MFMETHKINKYESLFHHSIVKHKRYTIPQWAYKLGDEE